MDIMKKRSTNKGFMWRLALAAAALLMPVGMMAQNSAPAPGSGAAFTPNTLMGPNGIGWNPGPRPPYNWGGPWGSGWGSSPSIVVNNPIMTPNTANQGVTNVVACGYDAQGIWRTLPLTVAYYFNGAQYNVIVLNAWNPWTDMWNRNVDQPAFNTTYYLNGTNFDFYTVLSTGTYYFNL